MNRINETDMLGKEHIKDIVALAKRGNGTVQYFSKNPLKNNANELKSSYVLDIDGTWFIDTGTYRAPGAVSPMPITSSASISIRSRDELVKYVHDAKAYALRQGREKALVEFNNKNRTIHSR